MSTDHRFIAQIEFRDAEISRLQAALRVSESKLGAAQATHDRMLAQAADADEKINDLSSRLQEVTKERDELVETSNNDYERHVGMLTQLHVLVGDPPEGERVIDVVYARLKERDSLSSRLGSCELLLSEVIDHQGSWGGSKSWWDYIAKVRKFLGPVVERQLP